LELDGVLLSWAVPKGPSLDPRERRLAVHVEDHPVEYAKFEGTIPKGEYGAGAVLLWDRGAWEALGDARTDYDEGKLKFRLYGEKLRGGWMLVQLRSRDDADNWLLIKERDQFARPVEDFDVTAMLPASVKTGRTIEEIAAGKTPHSKTRAIRGKVKPASPTKKKRPTSKQKVRRS
jgi:bifunctional non-homologous end joining protein LigD